MQLLIFNVDDTLIKTQQRDRRFFLKAIQLLKRISCIETGRKDFPFNTDACLFKSIFIEYFEREPSFPELEIAKSLYFDSLEQQDYMPVKGAGKFLNYISKQKNCMAAIATSGWRGASYIKCRRAGLNISELVMSSSDEALSQEEIIFYTLTKVRAKYGMNNFDSVVYFGDRICDWDTVKDLNISFVGVDYKQNEKLLNSGAPFVIKDYSDINSINNYLSKV